MKRFLTVSIAVVFAVSMFLLVGCGGKSQKINGVADEESQVMDEASQASKESLPTTYVAEAGDTLWSIAGKAEIYGNNQQWPIIYDANRDILDDYKKPLEEGQKLIIPRNISAVEIEAAKEKAKEYGMTSGKGSEAASSGDEEASEDSQNVAGMGSGKSSDQGDSSEYASSGNEEAAGEPTPIPEPVKSRKKGGNNMMMLLLALLGVIAVIIFFIISKQKKKEEEDEKGDGETKTNILD
jgi:LysM repeat protein